jgi:hypothetical protein
MTDQAFTPEVLSKKAEWAAGIYWLHIQTGSDHIPEEFKDEPFINFAEEMAEVYFEQYMNAVHPLLSSIEASNFPACYQAFTDTFATQLHMWHEKETLTDRKDFNALLAGIDISLADEE